MIQTTVRHIIKAAKRFSSIWLIGKQSPVKLLINNLRERTLGEIINNLAFLIVLLGLFYCFVPKDFFGLDSAARKRSQHYGTRVAAPWYPQSQSEALVVLFNDNYLKNKEGAVWPAPFEHHATLLRNLINSKPKIIFYDIVFGSRSDDTGLRNFLSMLDYARVMGVEIVITHSYKYEYEGYKHVCEQCKYESESYKIVCENCGHECEKPATPIYPEIVAKLKSRKNTNVALAAEWSGCDFFYPPINSCNDFIGRHTVPTVAFGLYSKWLNLTRQPQPKLKDNLYVYWGIKTPSGKLKKSFYLLFNPKEHSSKPYIEARNANLFITKTVNRSTDEKKEIMDMVQGKVVFVGANIGGNDLLESPVDGLIPGIFYHAMAFDNLVRFGESYLKDAERNTAPISHWLPFSVSSGDIFEAIVLAAVWLLAKILQILREEKQKERKPVTLFSRKPFKRKYACLQWQDFGINLSVAIIIYGITFILLYMVIVLLRWDFGNFIALLFAAFILKDTAELLIRSLFWTIISVVPEKFITIFKKKGHKVQ